MAYRFRSMPKYDGDYVPKMINKSTIKEKIYKAPKQPQGLEIYPKRLKRYAKNLFMFNNLNEYKELFEQLKILVKTVLNVLCEKPHSVNVELFNKINAENIKENKPEKPILVFPVISYNPPDWVEIFASIIPKIIIIPSTEWFDVLLYVFQNLMLSISAENRYEIEAKYKEEIKNTKNRDEKQKLILERKKELEDNRKNVYQLVNFLGDEMFKTNDINKYHIILSAITLRGLNFSPFIDYTKKFDESDYFNELTRLRYNGYYFAAELTEITLFYHLGELSLIQYFKQYSTYLEQYLKNFYEFNLIRKINGITNRLSPENYNFSLKNLLTFMSIPENLERLANGDEQEPRTIETAEDITDETTAANRFNEVKRILAEKINGIPPLLLLVQMLKDLNIPKEIIIKEQIRNPEKFDFNYFNAITYAYLCEIYTIEDLQNAELLPAKQRLNILNRLSDSLMHDKITTTAEKPAFGMRENSEKYPLEYLHENLRNWVKNNIENDYFKEAIENAPSIARKIFLNDFGSC